MIIRNRTTKNSCKIKAGENCQPSCIYKIADASRALQRIIAEFDCKFTQFLVNTGYVSWAYFLNTRFILQHLAFTYANNACQCPC